MFLTASRNRSSNDPETTGKFDFLRSIFSEFMEESSNMKQTGTNYFDLNGLFPILAKKAGEIDVSHRASIARFIIGKLSTVQKKLTTQGDIYYSRLEPSQRDLVPVIAEYMKIFFKNIEDGTSPKELIGETMNGFPLDVPKRSILAEALFLHHMTRHTGPRPFR